MMPKITTQSAYVSFFTKQKKLLKGVWIASAFPVIGILIYALLVFFLPFFGEKGLMHLKYIGWPIYGLVYILIWTTGLFLWINFKKKLALTDYQFVKDQNNITSLLVLLALPTFGLTIIAIIGLRKVKESPEFKKYWELHNHKMGEKDLYLSDKMPMRAKESIILAISWFILIFWALIILWPIFHMVTAAFNGNLDKSITTNVSFKFSFEQFKKLFNETQFKTWSKNTLLVAFVTLALVILGSTFSAYVYSRFRFKGKKASLILIMTLGLFPVIAGMITHIILSDLLQKAFSFPKLWYLILIYSTGGIIGNIFILKGYLDSISTEIDDAARIDGCSTWKVFSKIIFPLMKPMLAVVGLASFALPFGDYILPQLLLGNGDDTTLAVGLQQMTVDATGAPAKQTAFVAGSILVAIPISVIYLILQRYMKSGVTAGGVKG